jgi:hypothetical protein
MVGKAQKSHGVRFEMNSVFSLEKVDQWNPIRISAIKSRCHPTHVISGLLQPWKGSSKARNFKVINSLQHVFEKWVEHCKKVHRLPREVLRKRDCHHTSTKFRLGLIS